jgi:hypothetical protein
VKAFLSAILALVFCILLFAAFGFILIVIQKVTGSDFVLGVLGFAVATITASIQYNAAKTKEAEARLFLQKQEIYSELVETIMNLMNQSKVGIATDTDELGEKFRKIRTKLLIWGSEATLTAFDGLSTKLTKNDGTPEEITARGTLVLKGLFGSIRRDLGHKDSIGADLEFALGILNEPDRSNVRKTALRIKL